MTWMRLRIFMYQWLQYFEDELVGAWRIHWRPFPTAGVGRSGHRDGLRCAATKKRADLYIHLDGVRMVLCQPAAPTSSGNRSPSTKSSRSTSGAWTWVRSTCWGRKASTTTAP